MHALTTALTVGVESHGGCRTLGRETSVQLRLAENDRQCGH